LAFRFLGLEHPAAAHRPAGAPPLPEEAEAYSFTAGEMAIVDESMSSHVIGTPEIVLEGLVQLQERTQADELMISTRMHSYEARVRSLTLVAFPCKVTFYPRNRPFPEPDFKGAQIDEAEPVRATVTVPECGSLRATKIRDS
jgi:hypothetical protein